MTVLVVLLFIPIMGLLSGHQQSPFSSWWTESEKRSILSETKHILLYSEFYDHDRKWYLNKTTLDSEVIQFK